jgi:HD-GYP domain-containing protein (c-di-GMP phosphodiesterase class II)
MYSTFPPACCLYHNPQMRVPRLPIAGLRIRAPAALEHESPECEGPCVLIADESVAANRALIERLPDHVVVIAADAASEAALGDAALLSLAHVSDERAKVGILRTAFELASVRRSEIRLTHDVLAQNKELVELNRIGMALMVEPDREALLRQILTQVMRSTCSDAGAVYLLEHDKDGTEYLRFKVVRMESAPAPFLFTEETFPVDAASVPGHVALTKKPIVLDDIRKLPAGAPFKVSPFAEQRGYWIKSMLAIPMLDQRDAVVGVLQLVNRRSGPEVRIVTREDAYRHATAYTPRDVQFASSLAGQAAVLIENARLYDQVDQLFAGFVKAAVTAIDQRDPTTAGHSVRVATLVTDLAAALERSSQGRSQGIHFSHAQMRELRYAALLHDFGKVGVREAVLIKAKKLPPMLTERVDARFDLIRSTLQVQYERKRARLAGERVLDWSAALALQTQYNEQLARLARCRSLINVANEPVELATNLVGQLADIASYTFSRPNGQTAPYLEPNELHYLQIPHGSLDEEERIEIEAHATRTFEFLSTMPWTDDLKNTASLASSHHEKLDGSGYPRHLRGKDVSIQSRMLAIADIFDALTAADRPYKHAVSADQALDIIRAETVAGRLDSEVLSVMIDSGVYQRVLQEDWRAF